jgi:hypothetical protein
LEKRDLPTGNVMVYHIRMAPRSQKLTSFIKVLDVPACNTNKTEAKTLWMLQILGCGLSHWDQKMAGFPLAPCCDNMMNIHIYIYIYIYIELKYMAQNVIDFKNFRDHDMVSQPAQKWLVKIDNLQ